MQNRFSPLVIGAAILLGGVSIAAGDTANGVQYCHLGGFAGDMVKSICLQEPVGISVEPTVALSVESPVAISVDPDGQFKVKIPDAHGKPAISYHALEIESEKRSKALLQRATNLVSTCLETEGCRGKELLNSATIILARCTENHNYYVYDSALKIALVTMTGNEISSEHMFEEMFGEMLECPRKDETLFILSNKFSSSKSVKRGSTYYDTISISINSGKL